MQKKKDIGLTVSCGCTETHAQYASRVVAGSVEAAPQDVSLPILKKLSRKGYDTGTWRTSASATDGPCIAKDGDVEQLKMYFTGLRHNAPIFEKTHVGCKCFIEVTSVKKPKLPPVMVSAFGIVQ